MSKVSGSEDCVDVSLCLINCGCGNEEDKRAILCGACQHGKLDVVKELVEQHHVNPSGKHL